MQEILSKKHLGYLLKILRIKNGHSQDFVAKLLNVSRSNYSQIEIGNQYPTFDSLCIIASYYSKSYEWLLHGQGMPILIEAEDQPKIELKKIAAHSVSGWDTVSYVDDFFIKDYPLKRKNREYLTKLPQLSIPAEFRQKGGLYRAFIDANLTIESSANAKKRDILIGKLVNSYYEVLRNEPYILITNSEVLYVTIESLNTECMHLHCKNEYNNGEKRIFIGDIEEIWEIHSRYSGKINTIIENLENTIHSIEGNISRLEGEVAALYAAINTTSPSVKK